MENLTNFNVSAAFELCRTHPYYQLGHMIWSIGAFICICLGIPGHFLVISLMFSRRNRRQPICLYFGTIAICELIYLFMVFWLWCSALSLLQDPRSVLSCGTYFSLTIGSSHLSTLLLMMASIDRVLIVVCPRNYSKFVNRKKSIIKILSIWIFVLLVMIQYHFSYVFSPSLRFCEFRSVGKSWHSQVWPSIRLIIFGFLPCSITCSCSIIIFQNRFYRRPSTTSETSGSRQMRTASLLLVIYSIYYTLTVLPLNILLFFHRYFLADSEINGKSSLNCSKYSQWKTLTKFCTLLMVINYSNKFFVHYIISLKFRQDVRKLISRCCCYCRMFHKRTTNLRAESYR